MDAKVDAIKAIREMLGRAAGKRTSERKAKIFKIEIEHDDGEEGELDEKGKKKKKVDDSEIARPVNVIGQH